MAGTSHLAQVPDIAVLLYFEGEKPSVFQGGCCRAVKLILVLHGAGKPGGALPPLPGRCWYHAWEHAFLVCHVICPSGLCICYPSLCSHCSVYSGLFLVYHVMAGLCFCLAAQKLLEVSFYKQRDVRDHIWIHSQSADSSGVLYWLWVWLCIVSSLLCPLSQYPSCSAFFIMLELSPSPSGLSCLAFSSYPRPTTPRWAEMLRVPG